MLMLGSGLTAAVPLKLGTLCAIYIDAQNRFLPELWPNDLIYI